MKALVIEDSETDFRVIERYLEHSCFASSIECEWVQNPSLADLSKKIRDYDICFVDYNLESLNGIEIISSLRRVSQNMPFIMLTGCKSSDLYQAAISAGASEFLIKGSMSSDSIGLSIKSCMARLKRDNLLLEMAYSDELTKLANRAAFAQRCTEVYAADGQYCLILLDLDKFKNINDTYGHLAGDSTLVQFATHLKNIFGEETCIARIGGDEFGVILELGVETIEDIRSKLQPMLDLTVTVSNTRMQLHCSLGVSAFKREKKKLTANEVLEFADKDLYLNKSTRVLAN